jgi:hypothetical protein
MTVTWRRSAEASVNLSVAGGASDEDALVASAQGSDGVEQLTTVPDKIDAQIFQVLRRQVRQDGIVDGVVSEFRLILFEAKASQPTLDVHDWCLTALTRAHLAARLARSLALKLALHLCPSAPVQKSLAMPLTSQSP